MVVAFGSGHGAGSAVVVGFGGCILVRGGERVLGHRWGWVGLGLLSVALSASTGAQPAPFTAWPEVRVDEQTAMPYLWMRWTLGWGSRREVVLFYTVTAVPGTGAEGGSTLWNGYTLVDGGANTEGTRAANSYYYPQWPSALVLPGGVTLPDGAYWHEWQWSFNPPFEPLVSAGRQILYVVGGVWQLHPGPAPPPPPPPVGSGSVRVVCTVGGSPALDVDVDVRNVHAAAIGHTTTGSLGEATLGPYSLAGSPVTVTVSRPASGEVPALTGERLVALVDGQTVTVSFVWSSEGVLEGGGSGGDSGGMFQSALRWFLDRLRDLMRELFVPSDESMTAMWGAVDRLRDWGPVGLLGELISAFGDPGSDRLVMALPNLQWSAESGWHKSGADHPLDVAGLLGPSWGAIRAALGVALYVTAAVGVVTRLWPRQVV